MALLVLPYWDLVMRMDRSGLEYPCSSETMSAVNCLAYFCTQGMNTGVGVGVDKGVSEGSAAGVSSVGAGVTTASRSRAWATAAGVGVTVTRPALTRCLGRAWWNQAKVNRLTPSSRSVATVVRMLSYRMRFRRIFSFS